MKRLIRPNILIVSLTPLYGGGESYYAKLAAILAERYELRAIAANSQLANQLRELQIPVYNIEAGSSLLRIPIAATKIISLLRKETIACAHLNGQSESSLASLFALANIPTLSTRHTAFDSQIPFLKRIITIGNLRKVRKTICVSELLSSQLGEYLHSAQVTVIPNWVDPLPHPLAYMPPTADAPLRLLFVGRVIPEKGLGDLLQAMRLVKDISLDIVGDGPWIEEAKAKALGLHVYFHGFQKKLSCYFRQAHLFVFPSLPGQEGHPQTPLEAMAHGLPCLISDIAVNLQTADYGHAAELFPWGNIPALADKIHMLKNTPARLIELAAAGRAHVLSHYTKEQAKLRYLDTFEEVLAAK